MKFLESLFFMGGSYKDALGFHTNFFVDHGGFLYGFIIAIVVALLFSLFFYFGLSRKYDLAKRLNWWILSVIVAATAYFCADLMIIGGQGSDSRSTFYGANQQLVLDNKSKPNAKQFTKLKLKIEGELQRYQDVRFPFDASCAVWSWIFFFGLSVVEKRFSVNATQIPF